MRRFLSERNLVVILFLAALVTFGLAQQDTRKIEKMYLQDAGVSAIVPAPSRSANVEIPLDKKVQATDPVNVYR